MARNMAESREQHVQRNTLGFDAIINWPETQELLDAARRCLVRLHVLDNLNVPRQEPSNQQISSLLHYLAHKTANTVDLAPRNTGQDIYAPSPQESADSFTAWLFAPASPWNPLDLGGRSIENAGTTSPLVDPGLANSFPTFSGNPRSECRSTTDHDNFFPNASQPPQQAPPTEPETSESLNPFTLVHTQPWQRGTKTLPYPPSNVRNKGRSSIAFSNDTSPFPWHRDRESLITSITTPQSPETTNKRSLQTFADGVGSLSTSSKSQEDDCSHSAANEQVDSVTISGNRNEQPLTYAEAVRSNCQPLAGMPESAVSPAPSTVCSNKPRQNRFFCSFPGCDKAFDWEWKYKDHSKTHTKEKPFRCTVCDAYFGRDRDLVKHKQSQKHKKGVSAQVSIKTANSTEHTGNSRNLSPPERNIRSHSQGRLPRPSRGSRGGREQTIGGRRGRSAISGRRIAQPTAATADHDTEMGIGAEAGDNTDDTVELQSDLSGNLSKAQTPHPRSVKRVRTVSGNDVEDEACSEQAEDPDTGSFNSPISPSDSRHNFTRYASTLPSHSSRPSPALLSPSYTPNQRQSAPQASVNYNAIAGLNSYSTSNVPAITVSSFPESTIAVESQITAWMPAENRTTTSSANPDDYMQYLNIDVEYELNQATHPCTPIFWHSSGGEPITSGKFFQAPPSSTCPYKVGSDGG